jgi:hypothetical protein
MGHYQFSNLVMDGVAPVIEVVVENSWNTRVSEYVCISLEKRQSNHSHIAANDNMMSDTRIIIGNIKYNTKLNSNKM